MIIIVSVIVIKVPESDLIFWCYKKRLRLKDTQIFVRIFVRIYKSIFVTGGFSPYDKNGGRRQISR